MIRLPRPRETHQRENTIALINIVFLMLIFFLIAGTLTPPLDGEVKLIATLDANPADPPEALFVTADGSLRWQGRQTSVENYLDAADADGKPVKIAADQSLPAARLIDIVGELRSGGAARVVVVTERTSP